MEFLKEDARLDEAGRDVAVGELIALVGAVDATVQAQAAADAGYFCGITGLSGHAERAAAYIELRRQFPTARAIGVRYRSGVANRLRASAPISSPKSRRATS